MASLLRLLSLCFGVGFGLMHVSRAEFLVSVSTVQEMYDGRRTTIDLPLPGERLEQFRFEPADLLPADFQYSIRTFRGRSVGDSKSRASAVVTPESISVQLFHAGGISYLNSRRIDSMTLRLEAAPEGGRTLTGYQCLTGPGAVPPPPEGKLSVQSAGEHMLRTFRIAAGATGEFTEFFGSREEAVRQVVTAISRANEIFRREVGVTLQLVPDFDRMVFADSSSDPFSSNEPTEDTILECQAAFDSVIGSDNYDVGIVLTRGTFGLAYIRSVCDPARKGSSCIGLPEPAGDAFHVNLVTHELGHQFGANHTFNSPTGLCAERRNEWTSFEPGAGSTIMSYSSLPCDGDSFQPRHDAYFHSESLEEIQAFLQSPYASCAVLTPANNSPPIVDAGPEYFIPVGTPFALTASATDPEGDEISYCWEERDLGPAQTLGAPDNGLSPRFRSLPPTTSPTRIFPALEKVLAGTDSPEERLPQTNRFLGFRVVARDEHNDGAVSWADTQLQVTNVAGPFRITSHQRSVTLGGSTRVEWSTGGTEGAPFLATEVRILLSTNGGLSFPITLAEATANDGRETVTLPPIDAANARLKVEPTNNIFFDINDAPLAISSTNIAELVLDVARPAPGSLVLTWPSQPGTEYRLERAGAFPGSKWSAVLTTNAPGSSVSVPLSASTDAAFYRVVQP